VVAIANVANTVFAWSPVLIMVFVTAVAARLFMPLLPR
jgi:hypothetical protein